MKIKILYAAVGALMVLVFLLLGSLGRTPTMLCVNHTKFVSMDGRIWALINTDKELMFCQRNTSEARKQEIEEDMRRERD